MSKKMKMSIKSDYGKVVLSAKRAGKRGLNITVPVGMNGMAYDDFMFENESKIDAFRNQIQTACRV